MVWKQTRLQRIEFLVCVIRKRYVLLLIDSFQFCVEPTYYAILKTVSLNLCPIVNFIGGYVFRKTCNIVVRVCVTSCRTYGSHKFIIFVRNIIVRSHLRQTVYLVIYGTALYRISNMAVLFETVCYGVKQWSLFYRICYSVMSCSLKHKMFKVMCKTCRLRRIVLSTDAYCYICLNARFFFVYGQIYLQSVVECVNTCVHQITSNSCVMVIFCHGSACTKHKKARCQNQSYFHLLVYYSVFRKTLLMYYFNLSKKSFNIFSSTSPRRNSFSASKRIALSHSRFALSYSDIMRMTSASVNVSRRK